MGGKDLNNEVKYESYSTVGALIESLWKNIDLCFFLLPYRKKIKWLNFVGYSLISPNDKGYHKTERVSKDLEIQTGFTFAVTFLGYKPAILVLYNSTIIQLS